MWSFFCELTSECVYLCQFMVERPRAAQGMHMAPGQSLLFCPLGGGSSDSIYTGQVRPSQ